MSGVKIRYRKMVSNNGYVQASNGFFIPTNSLPGKSSRNYTITEIGEKELQRALFDFLNISVVIDQKITETHDLLAIFNFLLNWGTLYGIEPGYEKGSSGLMTKNDLYKESKQLADILFEKDRKGLKKDARDAFIKLNPFCPETTTFEIEEDGLVRVIEPRDLKSAITNQFAKALSYIQPMRLCLVCGKLYQKATKAKTCSDSCRSKKSYDDPKNIKKRGKK
jgi:predicted nucleic acid-binding Zn ribbon protein